jgi:hypothetical protein
VKKTRLHFVAKYIFHTHIRIDRHMCAIEYDLSISVAQPIRCTIFRVYWISLYMFRTVFPSIIRSSRLYIQYQVHSYVIQFRWMHASGHEMGLQFHLVPASKQSKNVYDIRVYLNLYVQSWTPDDGWKEGPKHVEWYSVNSKNCASSWFCYRNISRCTVPWTSNDVSVRRSWCRLC